MKFVLRHVVAALVVIGGCATLAAVTYCALLAWAILAGGGLGGPLTLPGMVIIGLAVSAASVIGVLAPVTLAAEGLRTHLLRMSRFVEIPIATLLLIAYAAAVLIALSASGTFSLIVVAFELLLLGVYWWSLQATDLFVTGALKLWDVLRRRHLALAQ